MSSSVPEFSVIKTPEHIKLASDALASQCDYMKKALELCGYPPLRLRTGGLEGLVDIIVAQQLSVASARAIWSRVDAVMESNWSIEQLQQKSDEELAGGGLSRPKIRTLRAIQSAIEDGLIDLDKLADIEEADAHKQLTQIKGIGPWTADIYIMFCLGRVDRFAPGDLALQIALADLLGLEERPSIRETEKQVERWKPYRAVAARLLWAYYRVEKNSNSGAPL